jgi:hypothetical protein
MSKQPLPSGALVCGRRFEPSRLQHQFWETAYQQVVPPGTTTRGVAPGSQTSAGNGATHPGKKTNPAVSEHAHPTKGVCA